MDLFLTLSCLSVSRLVSGQYRQLHGNLHPRWGFFHVQLSGACSDHIHQALPEVQV